MQLIGRRSVASVLRWVLGFVNVFVAVAVVATGLTFLASLIWPDLGLQIGLPESDSPSARLFFANPRFTFLAAFIATLSTWWILNRLRRMFLAVNQGDAFEHANVGRLQGVGVGLIGVQISAFILTQIVPRGVIDGLSYDLDLGSWLGILIVFMLAEVFRQGAAMRDDQQMTV
ncbi:DUF2975 domain-containing protein [Brevundimonas sp. NIBR11]|uniref:DUF2975 domain-containing protein n=1 Tax=Brevundimonas sp. NIBR11 TaxID=3015999 RepID=UPI0022F0A51F|nr:DUF2975 domain-containing protein [Brevundimonas sp. NIBR11]WGM32212.1 hypothetical protein KKHFBJBL_02463 [Brevundimonas sp. NIBR11]